MQQPNFYIRSLKEMIFSENLAKLQNKQCQQNALLSSMLGALGQQCFHSFLNIVLLHQ